jgi:hypothetical protein
MLADNKLELVVEVDVNKVNASIKSLNTGLSSMEQAAGKASRDRGLCLAMVPIQLNGAGSARSS